MYTSKVASTERSRIFSALALPHVAIAFGVSLSFIAWCCPPLSEVGKGFISGKVTLAELAWTIGTYILITCVSAAGYYLGLPVGRFFQRPAQESLLSLSCSRIWTVWIVIAAVGVFSTGIKILSSMGVSGFIQTIVTFNANAYKQELYNDYSIGPLSLRYVAILSGAVAIFRYLTFREVSTRTVISMGLLLSVALISSRLSVLWAIIIGVVSYLATPASMSTNRIKPKEILIGSLLVLITISALTISRTYMFYRERGAESMFAAVGSEFQRYLAAPFQGSIVAVNNPYQGADLNRFSGIDTSLTTNSTLLELAVLIGRWNVVALAAMLFVSSFFCGIIKRASTSYLVVLLGLIQCCHFEIWRLSMFQRGITLTLLITVIAVVMFYGAFRMPAIRLPQLRIRI